MTLLEITTTHTHANARTRALSYARRHMHACAYRAHLVRCMCVPSRVYHLRPRSERPAPRCAAFSAGLISASPASERARLAGGLSGVCHDAPWSVAPHTVHMCLPLGHLPALLAHPPLRLKARHCPFWPVSGRAPEHRGS